MIELKPSRNFLSDLRDNQIAALWMLIGSRRCFERVTPNGWQFLFWAVLACLANTLFSWLTAGGAECQSGGRAGGMLAGEGGSDDGGYGGTVKMI